MEQKIKADLKQAQLDRDETRVSTLRLLISEMTNLRIQKGAELGDPDIVQVLRKEVKKRQEASDIYKLAGRDDSYQKEQFELKILETYLPVEMADEELTKIVEEAINELGATSLPDMGKVMGVVMGKTKGLVDGGRISSLVKGKLLRSV